MPTLEESFEAACASGKIPGAVLVATNKTGSFTYSKSFGVRSLGDEIKVPLGPDSLLTLTSCTKLITTVGALQLVENGVIGLDDDVASTLPELANLEVLSGMKDGKGILKERQIPITLRHLLTHSAGTSYLFMSPVLQEYNKSLEVPFAMTSPKTVLESFCTPLTFEPGTSWTYSTGLDWTGLLIERLTKKDLEIYLKQNVFSPLGIDDITFWPDANPDLQSRKARISVRDPSVPDGSGKIMPFKGPSMVDGAAEALGGQGLVAAPSSYLKILQSLLVDDEKLLKKETAAIMFQPQLSKESQVALQKIYESKPTRGPCSIGDFPADVKYDWGLGGLLTTEDVKRDGQPFRRKGCLNWSGALNLFWFLDREAGLCGFYGGQVLPPGDAQVKEMIILFEKTMYDRNSQQYKL
ncbi:related to 1,4-butanediol diacrylate esterase [Phialocephala subalpina]|uniref:Related to 1,4-butanediol diacrylate esterase n=1 Tax=Phialocephala subalpina TaxID=576137 RepID=A0A1L7XUR2_9HELO|nr:related to 1,4-butanediol diacrylate esterase [Phialocephala subalpina]